MTDIVYEKLIKGDDRFRLNGNRRQVLPNIIDFSVDGVDSAILLIALDLQGIAVSAGSACEAGAVEASHVLKAMAPTKNGCAAASACPSAKTIRQKILNTPCPRSGTP